MKISLNWINDFVEIKDLDSRDLANRITMATAEVEEVIEFGKDIQKVVVGKVLKVEAHPDAQKLTVVQVDIGSEQLQCVCGAKNVSEGLLIAFVQVGGSVMNIPKITKAKLRGVVSNGMICSAQELGIADTSEGILELEGDYVLGTDIKEIIPIDDIIIEIDNKSLTHRPDLWGHYGIAREISAIYNKPLKDLPVEELKDDENLPKLNVSVEDTSHCFRYSSLAIDNVHVKQSPLSMQLRLFYCGVRPISALVDVTNYIMLEIGQPMHAFDKNLIKSVCVKTPEKTIQFETLDEIKRDISTSNLMIFNQDEPVAIAGVMGGKDSGISDATSSLFLESANFDAFSIRETSNRLGLRTESSARFEKSLDPYLTVLGIKRFVKLLKEMQGDIVIASQLADSFPVPFEPITIKIEKEYIDKQIGNALSCDTIVSILESLDFGVIQDKDTFIVKVPSYRATKDITLKIDIVEEITRIYGYDTIIPKTLNVTLNPLEYNEQLLFEHKVKELLAEKFEMNEVNSYIWYDSDFTKKMGIKEQGNVELANPSAPQMKTLRTSMIPSLFQFAQENTRFLDDFSMFEIGEVFAQEKKDAVCQEKAHLGIVIASNHKDEDQLFYHAKGIISSLCAVMKNHEPIYTSIDESCSYSWVHPVKSVCVSMNSQCFGYISVVNPYVSTKLHKKTKFIVVELDFDMFSSIDLLPVKYQEVSKYPEVALDFSFLVDKSIVFEDIDAYIAQYKNSLLKSYRFVDMYTGKNIPEDKKSLSFTFSIGSDERTLLSEEINEFQQSFIEYMAAKGYALR